MGLVGASLLALLVVNFEVPFWLATIGTLVVGTLFGVVMELVVVRRLFYTPRVIVLVATIGIAGLAQAVITAYPDLKDDGASYPVPLSKTWDDVAGLRISGAQIAILVVVPIVAVTLGVMLNRTTLGRTVKAAAENPDVVRVQGINPKVVSTAVWAIAGFLATLTMILIAGQSGSTSQLPVLGASTLARALVAAVIAGMVSFPRAMLAGVVIGVVDSLVLFNFLDKPGLTDLLLLLAVLVAVAFQSRGRREETQTFSFTPKVREIPENLRGVWWVKRLNLLVLGVVVVAAVGVPFSSPRRHACSCTRSSGASRSPRCRSPCSPDGPASSRWVRWRSPASARCSPRRSNAVVPDLVRRRSAPRPLVVRAVDRHRHAADRGSSR